MASEKMRDAPVWLRVVFETKGTAYVVGFIGSQASQLGIGRVDQQSIAVPGRVDGEMSVVMFAGRAEVVPHRHLTADGEDFVVYDDYTRTPSAQPRPHRVADAAKHWSLNGR